MRLDIKRAALVGLGLLVVSAVPALAGSYNVGGGWEQLYFWADVAAPDPAYGYGGEDIDGDAPFNDPFTFSLAADGILRITDVWESGDYFRIWDNGSIIGETPNVPWQLGEVESDPDLAFGNPGLSWGEFALGAGDHSLQFQNVLFEDGITGTPPGPDLASDAYFRVDRAVAPIPEPGTLALIGLGLGVAGIIARRRSRA